MQKRHPDFFKDHGVSLIFMQELKERSRDRKRVRESQMFGISQKKMPKFFGANPHKTLTRLIALSIVFDIAAVAIWAAFPAIQWSIYQLGFAIVGTEAAVAAALFALTLFGLHKKQKWAPPLAIVITVTQRVFGTYVFFPSPAIAATLVWSLVIVYFAYKTMKTPTGNQ